MIDFITKENRNIQIVLSPEDLKEALREIVTDILTNREVSKQDALVSRNIVNKRLHVDNSTLWRWDKTGYLKAIHIGRSVYYRESDVKRMEEGNYE